MSGIDSTSPDGVRIALHEFGGSGPTLVIAHANGFCAGAYRPLAAYLSGSFRCVGIDLRGHGDSAAPASGVYSWDDVASDIISAVLSLGEPDVVLFGHSLGGGTALLAEATHPGLLRGAYLYEPIVFPAGFRHPDGQNPMVDAARRRRAIFSSRAEVLSRYASRPPLNALRADCLAAYVEAGFADLPDGTVRLKCAGEVEAQIFATEENVSTERVSGLALPVVVARGIAVTGFGPGQFAPELVEALGNARLQDYSHLGHFGPLQDPETVGADATAFLSSI